mmetsp:Transcript_20896/g.28760  ORF Transcript_20896/g.28760 Transcript_20896/m.28760 type:complete len:99 (+) Transcript_20896:150-446(+)
MFLSIVYSAFALFCLALCSQVSGLSKDAQELSKVNTGDDSKDYTDGYTSLSSGYGFAAFFFFVAFVLALAAACHISPIISGSKNEAQTLKNPMELPSN